MGIVVAQPLPLPLICMQAVRGVISPQHVLLAMKVLPCYRTQSNMSISYGLEPPKL